MRWQHLAGRQLEFNDVGYLERKNDYQGYLTLAYRTLYPWWRTVETRTSLQVNLRRTLDGLNLWNEIRLAASANLRQLLVVLFQRPRCAARTTTTARRATDGAAAASSGRRQRRGGFGSRRRVTAWLSWTVDKRTAAASCLRPTAG